MKIQDLLEARKNPELNPKISINDAMASYAKSHKGKRCYISFTAIEKLGVNPKTKYNTPVGVYCYPLEYAMKLMGPGQSGNAMPFAGESKFANLFYVKGKSVTDLASIEDYEVEDLESQLTEILPPAVSSKVKKYILNAPSYAKVTTPGGQFWYVVWSCAEEWSSQSKVRVSVLMTKIFRALGYAGLVDRKGEGIIHHAEPTQAVIFDPTVISDLKRVDNKYSSNVMALQKAQGARATAVAIAMRSPGSYMEKFSKLVVDKTLHLAPQSLLDNITPDDALKAFSAVSSIHSEEAAVTRLLTRLAGTKKRLPKCEELMKDIEYLAFDYAISVLDGRFELGEESLKNTSFWPRYIKKFPEAAK